MEENQTIRPPEQPKTGIAHTNKDILFRVLSENYQDKSFAAYGLEDIPKIKRMLPSEYPVVATRNYGDNMFLLDGDILLCLEYESTTSWLDFLKYNKYVTHTIERLHDEGIQIEKVIIVVIYTGDMQSAPAKFDTGGVCIQTRQVFLSKFDTNGIYSGLKAKIEAGAPLLDEDVMKFIILPLTQPDKKRKQGLIEDTVELAKQVKDDAQQAFILAGLLTATNKFIDQEYSKMIRKWLAMTKVARIFEEEKIEAVNAAQKAMATNLLKLGMPFETIAEVSTLDLETVKKLHTELSKEESA